MERCLFVRPVMRVPLLSITALNPDPISPQIRSEHPASVSACETSPRLTSPMAPAAPAITAAPI